MRFVKEGEAAEYVQRLRRKIRESRAQQGLSIRNLAKLAGVTKRTVEGICDGRVASIASVYAVCAALGLQFDPIPTEEVPDADS